MSARALCTHRWAPNINDPSIQCWDFRDRTTLPFIGVDFLVTSDTGDPTDLGHAYAANGLLGEGMSDGMTHGACCTAFESVGGSNNGWCYTKPGQCLVVLDPVTGAVDGYARVLYGTDGQFFLTWDQRVPVGKEYCIACMAYFGSLRYQVRVTDQDVTGVSFVPRHLKMIGAYDGTYGPQNFGFFTSGLVSRGTPVTQGGRGLTWNTAHPPIIKAAVASDACYVDPSPISGFDSLARVDSMTNDGWTLADPYLGIQQHVVSAMGNVGPVALRGGVVHWENGMCAQESPYVVSGVAGTPLFARSTFGHLDTPNAVCSDPRADSYGVGIMGDDGIGYVASLRMDHASRTASSRMVRRLCSVEREDGNPINLDFAGFMDGGMSYGVAEDAPSGRQVTQFVALGSSPSN